MRKRVPSEVTLTNPRTASLIAKPQPHPAF
jgi:hypothetical protein